MFKIKVGQQTRLRTPGMGICGIETEREIEFDDAGYSNNPVAYRQGSIEIWPAFTTNSLQWPFLCHTREDWFLIYLRPERIMFGPPLNMKLLWRVASR